MSLEIINTLKKVVKSIRILQDRVSAIEGVPAGVIVMWSGTLVTIPDDWALCDGSNGTPDLRDKFIYGCSAEENPGATGGAATHQHSYSQVPSHSHEVGTLGADSGGAHTHGKGTLVNGAVGNHTHTYNQRQRETLNTGLYPTGTAQWHPTTATQQTSGGGGGHGHTISGSTGSGGSHSHTISGSTASTGVASPTTDAASSLPSYYKLAFIMKI